MRLFACSFFPVQPEVSMANLLKDYPVVVQFPIAWGEMDAFNHVNNVVYYRYFENARLAYFHKVKLMEVMEQTGVGPILSRTQCQYLHQLTYPDNLSVGARVSDMTSDRFTMQYAIASQTSKQIAAEGEGLLVSFDYRKNEKTPIPDIVRQHIINLENGRFPDPMGS